MTCSRCNGPLPMRPWGDSYGQPYCTECFIGYKRRVWMQLAAFLVAMAAMLTLMGVCS